MHPTNPPATATRNDGLQQASTLETLLRRGWFIAFYDPEGTRFGLPTYPFHWAPRGLLTMRQLRERGLRPGGQDIAAQILWRRGKRVAYLYREDLAKPKRQATPAQRQAIEAALRARRTCTECATEKPYYIRRSTGLCNDCEEGWTR